MDLKSKFIELKETDNNPTFDLPSLKITENTPLIQLEEGISRLPISFQSL
jgi:hypothetical protein